MTVDHRNSLYASTPFEGAEKLLEVWFAPSAASVQDAHPSHDSRVGLRKVPRNVWEDMLDTVKCKVLSVIEGDQTDAYLLRFIYLFLVLFPSLAYLPCAQRVLSVCLPSSDHFKDMRNHTQPPRSSAHPRHRSRARLAPFRPPVLLLPQVFHVP